jgi:Protein of unknown function (DUF2637)
MESDLSTTLEKAPPPVRPPAAPKPRAAVDVDQAADVDQEQAADQPPAGRRFGRLGSSVTVAGTGLLASIGFAGSYDTLRGLAMKRGFDWFSYVFPVGIDAGILVLYALDLHLIRRRKPTPVPRFIAHVLTISTIYFNASAARGGILGDPLGAAMHAVIPLLFVASIEAARRGVRAEAEPDRVTSAPPLSRWVLSPVPTFRVWRRMKLWDVRSYEQGVVLYRESVVYRARLKQRHGRSWRREASAYDLLPVTMAPYGLTVDQALALPQQEKERDLIRAEQEQRAKEQAAQRAKLRRIEAERQQVEAQKELRTAEADLAAVDQDAEAAAQQRAAEAEARRRRLVAETTVAEQDVMAEAEARRQQRARELRECEGAEVAEAAARAVEAERLAAEDKLRIAEAAREAAEMERLTAEDRRRVAEAEARDAAARADEKVADQLAAEAERQAAEDRRQAAEAELAAAEAEDLAGLTSAERQARRLARLIEQQGAEPSLAEIQTMFGISESTASVRRQRAREILNGR